MRKSMENEQLFLLEVVVEKIDFGMEWGVNAPIKKNTAIEVYFSNLGSMEIRPEGLGVPETGTERSSKKRNIDYSCGKSYLFPCRPLELVNALKNSPLKIIVTIKDGNCTGTADIQWSNEFVEMVEYSRESAGYITPVYLKDSYELKDNKESNVGNIEVFVRLSCFGNSVQTHIQIVPKDGEKQFLFKSTTYATTFQCQKYGIGNSQEVLPVAPVYNVAGAPAVKPMDTIFSATDQQQYDPYDTQSVIGSVFDMDFLNKLPRLTTSQLSYISTMTGYADIVSLRQKPIEKKFYDILAVANAENAPLEQYQPGTAGISASCDDDNRTVFTDEELTKEAIEKKLCNNPHCPAVKKFKEFGIGPLAVGKGLGTVYPGPINPPVTYGMSHCTGTMDNYGPYGVYRRPKNLEEFEPKKDRSKTDAANAQGLRMSTAAAAATAVAGGAKTSQFSCVSSCQCLNSNYFQKRKPEGGQKGDSSEPPLRLTGGGEGEEGEEIEREELEEKGERRKRTEGQETFTITNKIKYNKTKNTNIFDVDKAKINRQDEANGTEDTNNDDDDEYEASNGKNDEKDEKIKANLIFDFFGVDDGLKILRLTGGAPGIRDCVPQPMMDCKDLMQEFDHVLEAYKQALGPCGQVTCPFAPSVMKEQCMKLCTQKSYPDPVGECPVKPNNVEAIVKTCEGPPPDNIDTLSACGMVSCPYNRTNIGTPTEKEFVKTQMKPACGDSHCPYTMQKLGMDVDDFTLDIHDLPKTCGFPKCPYRPAPDLPPIHWDCPEPLPKGLCKNPNCPLLPKELRCLRRPKSPCGSPLCPFKQPPPCGTPGCPFDMPISCPYGSNNNNGGANVNANGEACLLETPSNPCPFTGVGGGQNENPLLPCPLGPSCPLANPFVACPMAVPCPPNPCPYMTCPPIVCPGATTPVLCPQKPCPLDPPIYGAGGDATMNINPPSILNARIEEEIMKKECDFLQTKPAVCTPDACPEDEKASGKLGKNVPEDECCEEDMSCSSNTCVANNKVGNLMCKECEETPKKPRKSGSNVKQKPKSATGGGDQQQQQLAMTGNPVPLTAGSDTGANAASATPAITVSTVSEEIVDKKDVRNVNAKPAGSRTKQGAKQGAKGKQQVQVGDSGEPKKKKKGRKYCYGIGDQYPGVKIGHKTCVIPGQNIPANMGWLWNIHTPCMSLKPRRGWRPGAIGRTIADRIRAHREAHGLEMLNPLNPKPSKAKKKLKNKGKYSTYETSSDETVAPKPTLQIKKKDGAYWITMNPLKDPMTLEDNENPYMDCTPMQFKIIKNKEKVMMKNEEDEEFTTCCCGEKDENEEPSSTDSELDIEFTPPAGIIRPEKLRKKKNVVHIDTQYDPNDLAKEKGKGKKGGKDKKGKGKKGKGGGSKKGGKKGGKKGKK